VTEIEELFERTDVIAAKLREVTEALVATTEALADRLDTVEDILWGDERSVPRA
jgi:hypothetical protein